MINRNPKGFEVGKRVKNNSLIVTLAGGVVEPQTEGTITRVAHPVDWDGNEIANYWPTVIFDNHVTVACHAFQVDVI